MKNSGVPIVKEGLPFLFVALISAIAFSIGGWWSIATLLYLVAAYIAYFFRNPERLPPVGTGMVASPADGRVIYVGPSTENEFLNREMTRVSIFMSLIDVHVNRVPVDGTVKDVRYHRGRFMAAFEDRAGEENERNALLIETPQKHELVLVQIAGLVARRIVCYPAPGMFIMKGQRMGLIRFGSRCDLYLPKDSEVLVKVGDRSLGGETMIAKLPELDKKDEAPKGAPKEVRKVSQKEGQEESQKEQ